jgi:membrane protein DedA with SNARE-associated domain
MHFSFPEILALLTQYKYFFLFPVTVIEGPIITVIAGFFVSLGILNFIASYAVVVLGDLTGDVLFYYLGRFGRKNFIDRWGHYFGATPARIDKLTARMQANAAKVLLTGKTFEGTGAMVQMAAGAAHIPFGRFLWCDTIPTLVKSLIYLLIGFYFGQAYAAIANYLDYASYLAIVAIIILTIGYFIVKKYIAVKAKKMIDL